VTAAVWRGGWRDGLPYGALGLPLAFVALPLYVVLPNHYATEFGIPLAVLGALLLGARLFDAFTDPWIGRLADGWFAHSSLRVLVFTLAAAGVLAVGFRGLFFPAVSGTTALLWWCGALLALTYLSATAWWPSCTSPGARGWAVTRGSARASCPGAKALRSSACWWPACCPRWPGWVWPASSSR
jgi:Na+/melibiose symporter-like transporter